MQKITSINYSDEELDEKILTLLNKALKDFFGKGNEVNYLTRKETADKLHISLPTLNEYTKIGKLKGYRINGRVLYKEEEINSALTAVETLKYKR